MSLICDSLPISPGRLGRSGFSLLEVLVALLILSVGLRFAVELFIAPQEPFSVVLPESAR